MPETVSQLEASLVARVREAFPEVQAIYLYGSYVRGEARPGSDLDVALLLPRGSTIAPMASLHLGVALSSLAGRPVDLALLDLRSVVHCKEVVAYGRRIASFDSRAIDEFEMQTFSDYARLREDRAPVERAYSTEGH